MEDNGGLDEAKVVLGNTVDAGLYKEERFTGNHSDTAALGLLVLDGIRTPERVRQFFYVRRSIWVAA